MAYQIIRVAGYKNAAKGQKGFGGIQIHDQREKGVSHTNEDIDWSRVHLNYDLHNGDNKINFAEKINERIASLDLKKALRKDANVMAQIFISASPEWFKVVEKDGSSIGVDSSTEEGGNASANNNSDSAVDEVSVDTHNNNLNGNTSNRGGRILYEIDPEIQRKYFEDAYKWVCNRYGTENIISATVHLDEATPHMHINLVPVANGKVCYADLFTEKPQKSRGRNGGQLTALHDDFYKHNKDNGYDLERGELQSVTGKKEHLSVLDFKKQEREKEVGELDFKKQEKEREVKELSDKTKQLTAVVNKLDKNIKESTLKTKELETEIKNLETLKTHTAENVTELRFFASNLQADVNDLEEEKTHLHSLKNDLKQQIKTERDILKNLEGKIKTRKGIEQIRERTSKTLFGDTLKISKEDFDSLIKTTLTSPLTKTVEENKSLKTENEALTEKVSQIEPLERKLDQAYKTIKIKDEEITDLSEQLAAQTKRADHWVTQARTYETNYNRVLKERNALKGLSKDHGHNLN